MRYLGGKSRKGKEIASIVNSFVKEGHTILEPFCGSCWVTIHLHKPVIASDYHEDLILMWTALQQGWQPPTQISEDEYRQLKQSSPSALRGFVGFACSFGGKWFGGYARARNSTRNFTLSGANSIAIKLPNLQDVAFFYQPYWEWNPDNMVVYCDPPYQSTTQYSMPFDHDRFWATMDQWSQNNTVLVSEYTAPAHWEIVWQSRMKTHIDSKRKQGYTRVDKLFRRRRRVQGHPSYGG